MNVIFGFESCYYLSGVFIELIEGGGVWIVVIDGIIMFI